MNPEIRRIIEGMSPVELCMLQDIGMQLPNHLIVRAEMFRELVKMEEQRFYHRYYSPARLVRLRREVA